MSFTKPIPVSDDAIKTSDTPGENLSNTVSCTVGAQDILEHGVSPVLSARLHLVNEVRLRKLYIPWQVSLVSDLSGNQ